MLSPQRQDSKISADTTPTPSTTLDTDSTAQQPTIDASTTISNTTTTAQTATTTATPTTSPFLLQTLPTHLSTHIHTLSPTTTLPILLHPSLLFLTLSLHPSLLPSPLELFIGVFSYFCAGCLISVFLILDNAWDAVVWPWKGEGDVWMWWWEVWVWRATVNEGEGEGEMSVIETPVGGKLGRQDDGVNVEDPDGSMELYIPPTPMLPRSMRSSTPPASSPTSSPTSSSMTESPLVRHKSGLLGESPAPVRFKHFSGKGFAERRLARDLVAQAHGDGVPVEVVRRALGVVREGSDGEEDGEQDEGIGEWEDLGRKM